MNRLLHRAGIRLADYLAAPRPQGAMPALVQPHRLVEALRPGDVLLIEGRARISAAIKYVTRSDWSHAALYIGPAWPSDRAAAQRRLLIEADLREGVRAVPLDNYAHMHTRICRPVGLSQAEIARLVDYAIGRLGQCYDLRHLYDMLRYLVPAPPVPAHWRRRLLALGSGDPTRAICSTLIAQAFEAQDYPILPDFVAEAAVDADGRHRHLEMQHIREHGLYAPRDFDISPYFEIVKPALDAPFDFHGLAARLRSDGADDPSGD